MPSLRFENPTLQPQFLELLQTLPFQTQMDGNGSVVCTDEQWPQVNAIAHRVRDSCYRWYFSWCNSTDETAEFESRLSDAGLRFEVEYHEEGKVFLLPKEDEGKHWPSGEESTPLHCSFCSGRSVDRQKMYATGDVAICDECIDWLYADLRGLSEASK